MRAFSLIELMIVITIIGILAAIAVPAYSDYVKRAEISEIMVLMNNYKNKAVEYYYANGSWPEAGDLGIGSTYEISPLPLPNVTAAVMQKVGQGVLIDIATSGGYLDWITCTDGIRMRFLSNVTSSAVSWSCTVRCGPLKWAPANCQTCYQNNTNGVCH